MEFGIFRYVNIMSKLFTIYSIYGIQGPAVGLGRYTIFECTNQSAFIASKIDRDI